MQTPVILTPSEIPNNAVTLELGEKYKLVIGNDIIPWTLLENVSSEHYENVFVNLLTLFRNFNDGVTNQTTPKDSLLISSFTDSLRAFNSVLVENNINPIYYVMDYSKPITSIKWCTPHVPTTEKQVMYSLLEGKMIKFFKTLYSHTKTFDGIDFRILFLNGKIPYKDGRNFVVTHVPYDLLPVSYKKVSLVESYTGAIKEKKDWIKKLSANKDYHNLPFCLFVMCVIGDRSKLFSSLGKKYTTMLCNIAEKHNWNKDTTHEKILYTIDKELTTSKSAFNTDEVDVITHLKKLAQQTGVI